MFKSSYSQELSNLRHKTVYINSDTLLLDSLSIVPGSLIMYSQDNKLISNSLYNVNYASSIVVISSEILEKNTRIYLSYRVFPIMFSANTYHKKIEDFNKVGEIVRYSTPTKTSNKFEFFNDNQINKSGNLSRGISFGNNRDAVINSNLNLQLSGKFNDKFKILAAISDKNIPIQPEGNSQQLNEFDKMYISLYNDNTKIIGGDFLISKPRGYFMNYNKKVQGAYVKTKFALNKKANTSLITSISGAIAKGKYCKKNINAQEGNQGPYKLTGSENEQYIIIIAGSEKIYINGRILKRGKDQDYVINYNSSELSFTARQPITKDSRIVVEYEYSERSYARFLVQNTNELKTNKGDFWLNIYSEQDAKNQTLTQSLSDNQKQLLFNIGDSINNAFTENVDSVEYRKDIVLYEKTDTMVAGVMYSIFEYSNNSEIAYYKLGFSLVGENNGNYILTSSAANGKVYKWIAPLNGALQGKYEPVKVLVTPKKKQMISIGGDIKLSENTNSFFEISLSNNDVNTFSDKNNDDNIGYALLFKLENKIQFKNNENKIHTTLLYKNINKDFSEIERIKIVEFDRDWNIENKYLSNENLLNFKINYQHKQIVNSVYDFKYLNYSNNYTGYNHTLSTIINKQNYDFSFMGSALNTSSLLNETKFIRHSASFVKKITNFELGIESESENNQWHNIENDSLRSNSFLFYSYKIFIRNSDSTKNNFFANYMRRYDYLPNENYLKRSSVSDNISVGYDLMKNRYQKISTLINYRKLVINDTIISASKPDNSLTARANYSVRALKGALSSSLFYEIGSGLEPKREYSYIKVAQGQGIYSWSDYNNNAVAELNEFEIAKFKDQGNYIRIYMPGTDYTKIFSNEFSQVINLSPRALLKKKSVINKFVSRFSNRFAFRIKQKSVLDDFAQNLNPFERSINDTSVINFNSTLRNTFSFNRSNAKFSVDYIYQKNNNKIFLMNGCDMRSRSLNSLGFRWNVLKSIVLIDDIEMLEKKYESEFFSSKNYNINSLVNKVTVEFQPGLYFDIDFKFKYSQKENILASEKSKEYNLGTIFKLNSPKNGSLFLTANIININYNNISNTAIAYEMLEGLKPGKNSTWEILFQRRITKVLDISIVYNGRAPANSNVVHAGSMQIRASF